MHKSIKAKVEEPTFIRKDERGLFVEVLNEGPWETIIHGSMKCGAEMGPHYHRECRAYFYLINGSARVQVRHLIDDSTEDVALGPQQGIYFLPFETHLIRYLENSDFLLLKSFRYSDDDPDIFPSPVEA